MDRCVQVLIVQQNDPDPGCVVPSARCVPDPVRQFDRLQDRESTALHTQRRVQRSDRVDDNRADRAAPRPVRCDTAASGRHNWLAGSSASA
jgi:hypothetical protein